MNLARFIFVQALAAIRAFYINHELGSCLLPLGGNDFKVEPSHAACNRHAQTRQHQCENHDAIKRFSVSFPQPNEFAGR